MVRHVGVFILVGFTLSACRPARYRVVDAQCTPCDVRLETQRRAAPNAVDCDGGTACEAEAARQERSFISVRRWHGVDAVVTFGRASLPDAGVWLLSRDDNVGLTEKCRAFIDSRFCAPLLADGGLTDCKNTGPICSETPTLTWISEGASSDLWCADRQSSKENWVCSSDKKLLDNKLQRAGAGSAFPRPTLRHPHQELTCNPFELEPRLLRCTSDENWRRALGFRDSDREQSR